MSAWLLSFVLCGFGPHIADDVIKEIPIIECDESFCDIRSIENPRITMLNEPASPFQEASLMRVSVFRCLEEMVENLDALAPGFGYTPGKVSIRVYEGLRSLDTQKALFEKKVAEYPELSREEAELEASKWISPVKDNIPVHVTGAAVDLRLYDEEKGEFLDMGIFGTIWGPNEEAPTFYPHLTEAQKQNRLYCHKAATLAGLVNYPYEFWHYSYGDRYWAFTLGKEPLAKLRQSEKTMILS